MGSQVLTMPGPGTAASLVSVVELINPFAVIVSLQFTMNW